MRVTFRGRPRGAKATPKAAAAPPTRQDCDGCQWFTPERERCFHPRNGRPCNPARNQPWAWGMACPVTAG